MTLVGYKSIAKSGTVWGGVLAVVAGVVPVLEGFGLLPTGAVDEISAGAVAIAGGLFAIYRRIKATKGIK